VSALEEESQWLVAALVLVAVAVLISGWFVGWVGLLVG